MTLQPLTTNTERGEARRTQPLEQMADKRATGGPVARAPAAYAAATSTRLPDSDDENRELEDWSSGDEVGGAAAVGRSGAARGDAEPVRPQLSRLRRPAAATPPPAAAASGSGGGGLDSLLSGMSRMGINSTVTAGAGGPPRRVVQQASCSSSEEEEDDGPPAPRPAQRAGPPPPARGRAAPSSSASANAAAGGPDALVLQPTSSTCPGPFVLDGSVASRLYPHQVQGIRWLWSLHQLQRGGILGDEMGLGKTMQVAAYLAGLMAGSGSGRLARRVLVVAPKTLLLHWEKELGGCGLGRQTRCYLGGSEGERAAALNGVMGPGGGVLLTTYGMVQHNAAQLTGPGPGQRRFRRRSDDGDDEEARAFTWDYMILDGGACGAR